MARFFKKREQNKGLAPGSMAFIGEKKVDEILIRVIDYDQNKLKENELKDIKEGKELLKSQTITWINIDGLHDVTLMKELGDTFELHPLLFEDIMNTGQRPKVVEFDNCVFIVLKMLRYSDEEQVIAEQLSLAVGDNFLLTFQEQKGDVFDPVRERIRKQKGRIRVAGFDYTCDKGDRYLPRYFVRPFQYL